MPNQHANSHSSSSGAAFILLMFMVQFSSESVSPTNVRRAQFRNDIMQRCKDHSYIVRKIGDAKSSKGGLISDMDSWHGYSRAIYNELNAQTHQYLCEAKPLILSNEDITSLYGPPKASAQVHILSQYFDSDWVQSLRNAGCCRYTETVLILENSVAITAK